MTEKLYYEDSHLFDFTATVLKCEQDGEIWKTVLDRTAFFPEGGGQPGDRGVLGGVCVTDTHERGGEVIHYLSAPLAVGEKVSGSVDRELRLRRMQNHSGEHIFSGTAHRLFGCSNVGFHMGEDGMTLDFDREMDAGQILQIETLANEAVRDNLPVKVWYPSPDELAALDYRSKKELEGAVRIVEIPGVDCCACCAPHVERTGEIGVIKVQFFERHRGGIRLNLVCGMQALEDYRIRQQSVAEISALLSAKRHEVTQAVQRILQEKESMKEENAALKMELIAFKAAQVPETEGNICLFESIPDEIAERELVNLLMEKCGGLAAVFFPTADGGFRYIIGSRSMDLRKEAKAINIGIGGRGGGRPEMIQGSAGESEESIRSFLLNYNHRL
ncbi:MAG: alanyl-tRNA editing protein [Oscillospiraceae bacterium]|nr:alanyl-tRNA editing protein [Oscillospiraceae bacterium]